MRVVAALAESDVRAYVALLGAVVGTGGMVYAASRFLQKSEQVTLTNYRDIIDELREEIDRVNRARIDDRTRCDEQLAAMTREVAALKLNLRALGEIAHPEDDPRSPS